MILHPEGSKFILKASPYKQFSELSDSDFDLHSDLAQIQYAVWKR